MHLNKKAKLVLENGEEFEGFSFGHEKSVSGEVVFSTGMVGYPESLTDTSYKGQILVFTYPLIGNYGVPGKDIENDMPKYFESEKIQATALIVSDYSFEHNHWNSKKSLAEWMKEEKVPGIYGVDTRRLTKTLREKGAMLGKIIFDKEKIDFFDPNIIDIVKEVTVKKPILYNEKSGQKRIVVIDCGVKLNIIRHLIKRNFTVMRVPHDYDFLNENFNGILISNGPGNPKMCKKAIENVSKALKQDTPIMGICLGSQIMALAAGGNTYKLKYGHRSQNQPCILAGTKRCYITTQNHGFAVDMKSMGNDWEEYFINANDGTNEGIKHKTKPFFAVQFHPENFPGPTDTEFLFDEFVKMVR
jgi:carbamoyl-phosphate synthase small subunit